MKKTGKLKLTLFSFHRILPFPIPIQSCPRNPPPKKRTPRKTPAKSQDPPPNIAKIKTWENVEKRWNNPPWFPRNRSHWTTTWIRRMPVIYSDQMQKLVASWRPSVLWFVQVPWKLYNSSHPFCSSEVWLQKYRNTVLSSTSGSFEDMLKFRIYLSSTCSFFCQKGLSKVAASMQYITRWFGVKCLFSPLHLEKMNLFLLWHIIVFIKGYLNHSTVEKCGRQFNGRLWWHVPRMGLSRMERLASGEATWHFFEDETCFAGVAYRSF